MPYIEKQKINRSKNNHMTLVELVLIFVLSQVTTPASSPEPGLAVWYPLDGNAEDASGNGNNGTIHGAVSTADRSGKANGAMRFDGLESFIEVPNSDSLNISGDTSLTIAAWVRTETNPPLSTKALVWKWGRRMEEDDQFVFGLSDGGAFFGLSDLPSRITSGPLPLKTWFSVAGVYNAANGSIRLYINRELEATKRLSSEIRNTDEPVLIGKGEMAHQFFAGDLDEIRIYNKALSRSDIQRRYRGPSFEERMAQIKAATPIEPRSDAHLPQGAPFEADAEPLGPQSEVVGDLPEGGLGPQGKFLRFDGKDDFICISDPRLDLKGSFAVSAWACAGDQRREGPLYFRGDEQFAHDPCQLVIFGDKVRFRIDGGPGLQEHVCFAESPLHPGWHLWTGVYDSGKARLYLYMDGQLVGESVLPAGPSYDTSGMKSEIGSINRGKWGVYKGDIDQFSIWNIARTADDIHKEFTQGLKGNEAGLVAFCTFDEEGPEIQNICDPKSNKIFPGHSCQSDPCDPARVTIIK
ncbi:MAG: hypothetical protein BWY09_00968 [Candidatus Hydrogenedentes bacterium ADurb.Bin179]|nr:MAG: hypothetical protein BWY09_00968 [Candidatus Hydrogenedentes bacterium ADurb.Bin179]